MHAYLIEPKNRTIPAVDYSTKDKIITVNAPGGHRELLASVDLTDAKPFLIDLDDTNFDTAYWWFGASVYELGKEGDPHFFWIKDDFDGYVKINGRGLVLGRNEYGSIKPFEKPLEWLKQQVRWTYSSVVVET